MMALALAGLSCTLTAYGADKNSQAEAAQSVVTSQQNAPKRIASSSTDFDKYFTEIQVDAAPTFPDEEGFIRRWTILEPISKPNSGNTVFVDSYLRTELTKEYFPGQFATELPKKLKLDKPVKVMSEAPRAGGRGFGMQPQQPQEPQLQEQQLKWHCIDSKFFNVKLFRFATNVSPIHYGVIFCAYTIINCEEEMTVRLAAGSNSGSMWWVNGEEVLLLQGDRRMVADDGMSAPFTLKPGKNMLRVEVINGPGMSDMCVRFVDEQGNPVRSFTVNTK